MCALTALTLFFVQRTYLLGDLDQRVTDAAEHRRSGARVGPAVATDLTFLDERGQAVGTITARLDADGGVSTARVVPPDGGPRSLGAAQRAALEGIEADGSLHTRSVPGLGTYRVTALGGSGQDVLTGLPMEGVQDMIRGLVMVEAAVAVVGIAAAGCVSAFVIRRQLRPLGRVAASAVEVSRAPLDHGDGTALTRVPEHDTDPGSEAGQVGAAINRMIDQVESSLVERRRGEERMRRFLADASHELRTPLASIAGYAELMNGGNQKVEPVMAWRRVSAESARMTGLVEDLLLLARLDAGRPPHSAEVDLAVMVADAVWDARAGRDGRDWQLALLLHAPALVTGDEARLQQALANLLANARVHTPVGTTVVASVEATDERCVIRVRDDGPGIPPALRPRSSNASPGPTPRAPAPPPRQAAPAWASPSRRRSRRRTEAGSESRASRGARSSPSNCRPSERPACCPWTRSRPPRHPHPHPHPRRHRRPRPPTRGHRYETPKPPRRP